jgi:hypothetical protein
LRFQSFNPWVELLFRVLDVRSRVVLIAALTKDRAVQQTIAAYDREVREVTVF